MDERIREIVERGHWSAGVFDSHPKKGGRIIRIDGTFATEAEAVAKANAVIAEGRPDIATFIHQPTAKPSVHYNLSHSDIDELARIVGQYRSETK